MGKKMGPRMGRTTFPESVRFALNGIVHVLRSQPNIRYQLLVAAFVVLLGFWLSITYIEWAIVSSLIFLVLAFETFNTAIEAVVDLVTDEYQELARIAKDASAGAVLLLAVGSVIVGILIFLPRLVNLVLGGGH